ncbi:MAG: prepilin-type N-terminal cleavage/methylation domain-containing protein [Kiritimatiellia bacterium]
MKTGFSLIELLVAVAVLAVLAALAAPPLLASIERGRVGRTAADLQTVEVALEAYRTDHGHYPPVTVSCMAIDAEQVLQLPQELADGGYLPENPRTKTSTLLEDPFRPGHTYKYAAPENYWLNGSRMSDRYPVWVPSDFPSCQAEDGRADDSPNSPLAWAVWSMGPRPDPTKALSFQAPLAASTWYRKTGDAGVIARYKARDGATWSTLR